MKPAERDRVEREVLRAVEESPFEAFEIRIGQDRSLHLLLDRREGRLSVDDAARFNHELRRELATAGIDVDKWTIVVESPGAFRALRQPWHFEKYAGARVRVVRRGATAEPRVIVGILRSVTAEGCEVEPEGGRPAVRLRFDEIAEARLDPRLPF